MTHTDSPADHASGSVEASDVEPAGTSEPPAGAAPGPGARAVVLAIRGYQLARAGHVSPCRFTPTCSQYAVEAFTRHGVRRGLRLTLRRLGRCRPGGPFGLDPVPE